MTSRLRKFLLDSWLKVSDGLFKMQLAHYGGRYSIERTLVFEEYSRNTSFVHVVLVVMSPPIFTAAVLLFQEIVPLQDPTEGWMANWGFWIRAGILGIANGHEAITQIPPWLNVPSFTTKQIALYSFFTGVGLVAGGMIVAEVWIFPIPFFLLTLSLILSAVLIGLMRIIAGGPAFRLIASRKEELRRLNNVATLETLMCVGYPLYQVLFTKVNNTAYELQIILSSP